MLWILDVARCGKNERFPTCRNNRILPSVVEAECPKRNLDSANVCVVPLQLTITVASIVWCMYLFSSERHLSVSTRMARNVAGGVHDTGRHKHLGT